MFAHKLVPHFSGQRALTHMAKTLSLYIFFDLSLYIFFDLVAVIQILNTPDFFHDVIHKPFTRQMS
jgi:hypothetical protein